MHDEKKLPEVPEAELEDKFTWMTNYFCNDVGLALCKLEEMNIDIEKYVDQLSSWWPAGMYDFETPEQALMFILKTYKNFQGGDARFLKVTDEEAVGEVKCAVPYFTGEYPRSRKFQYVQSSDKENVWCKYWCNFWFKNAAAKAGWDYQVCHEGDKCIWSVKRIKE